MTTYLGYTSIQAAADLSTYLGNTGAQNLVGTLVIADDSGGNNLRLTTSLAAVGPIARWARSSATARTWQLRLGTDGSFQFVDETGGAVRALIDTSGAFVLGTDPGGSARLRVGGDAAVGGALSVFAGAGVFGTDGAINFRTGGVGTADRFRVGNLAAGSGVNLDSVNAAENAFRPLGITSSNLILAVTVLTLSGFGGGTGVVSVGAADSGGAGFRLLRVPN